MRVTVVLPDGILRTSDLADLGYSRKRIRAMAARGELVELGRGLYRAPGSDMDARHELAAVAKRAPRAIICATSALRFHGLEAPDPGHVCLLIQRGYHAPQMPSPAIESFHADGEGLEAGVEEHVVEGVTVRVTCVAKTIADCVRYRSRIGPDIALRALEACIRDHRAPIDDIRHYARICRVDNVMRPHIDRAVAAPAALDDTSEPIGPRRATHRP